MSRAIARSACRYKFITCRVHTQRQMDRVCTPKIGRNLSGKPKISAAGADDATTHQVPGESARPGESGPAETKTTTKTKTKTKTNTKSYSEAKPKQIQKPKPKPKPKPKNQKTKYKKPNAKAKAKAEAKAKATSFPY